MFRQSVHACFSSQEQDLTNAISAYEITSKFGLHSLDQHPVLIILSLLLCLHSQGGGQDMKKKGTSCTPGKFCLAFAFVSVLEITTYSYYP